MGGGAVNAIIHYAESLGDDRAIMRVDIVADDELVMSYTEGSPAPIETVRKHERTVQSCPSETSPCR
jgi:hypothetical protein